MAKLIPNGLGSQNDQDRTRLERTYTALWENVGELWHMISIMGGHVFVKDADLRFLYVSDLFAQDRGLTPEEVVGKTDYDVFPRTEAEQYRADDRAVMEKGEVVFVNDPRWTGIKVPIKDARGRVVAVAGWTRWDEARQRLAERLFHFASVVLCSADAIMGLSLGGEIQSWNPGAEEVYGYAPEEVMGRSIALLCASEHQEGELLERLEEAASGATVRDHETTHLRKDGKEVRVSVALSPIVGAQGMVVGVSMIARDITERVRMEQTLRTALAQLVGAHAELSQDTPARTSGHNPHRAEVDKVAREIRRDPYQQFDFAAQARRLGLSHGHFRELFRDHAGRPLHDYVLVWRMRKAAKELRDSTKPVKVIALDSGYGDPAQFSKLFKKKIGVSPRQYRQVVRSL